MNNKITPGNIPDYKASRRRYKGGFGDLFMYESLQETLGIHFENPSLLQQALTHRSYIYETAGAGLNSNERLEFLGDSILAFISADYLYRTFPDLSEGELSDLRAALVRRETLAAFAQEINLGNYLLMGKGEQSSGVSQRVLASAFEAVLGALFLDQGIKVVQRFLMPGLEPLAQNIVSKRLFKDQKSLFQEIGRAHV